MKHFSLLVVSLFAILLPSLASASTSAILVPTATGTYSEWTPKTAVAHYTTVDETPCNGTTDYVATSTTSKRDSFAIALATIPDNSLISAIAVAPCASRATTGTGTSTLNVFYRYNGANSSDLGTYLPSGTTPTNLATSTWSSLSLTKTSTSTLEIGMVYTSGTKGARLSRIATQLTYTTPGAVPSATTSAASSVSTSSALLNGSANPNSTSTTAWFRIATSTPGTCNDTFGTRVPISLSTNLGAGTSSVAYSTTTTGLSQNTTYYYCAIAQNGNGKGYGGVQSFTTTLGVATISSPISQNTTWTTASGTYVIASTIAINSGITLTVNPGVVIKFNSAIATPGITVNGTLNAQGTAVSPIYFTSYKDDSVNGDTNGDGTTTSPAAANWASISVSPTGSSTLDNTIIRYGGSSGGAMYVNSGGTLALSNSDVATSSTAGVYTFSGVTTIASSTIRNNVSYGVQHNSGTTTITTSTIRDNSSYGFNATNDTGNLFVNNNVFANNTKGAGLVNLADNLNFVHANNSTSGGGKGGLYIYGSPGKAQTWYADPLLPYVIATSTGAVSINSFTITVNSGAVFKFEGATANLLGNSGTFSVLGTPASSIYFTSIKDDSIGGDTNGDGSATSPAAGDWDGLAAQNTGTISLTSSIVRYGGAKMLYTNSGGSTINLLNSEIASSSNAGIYHDAGIVNATGTSIHNNRYGYYYNNPSNGAVAHIASAGNTIYANSVYGIFNNSTTLLNAEQIYWPASTTGQTMNGPYSTTTNPSGHGDAVLPTWIDFEPWVSVVSGTIATNTTWTASSTYVVDGTLTVATGTTLNIYSGTVVKFKDAGSSLVVNGILNSDSAASPQKIYFTSFKDDSVGGDTNGDGSASSPGSSNWVGVKVNAGGLATIRNNALNYSGSGASITLWNNGGSIAVYNSDFATGTVYGVYNTSGDTNILSSNIRGYNYGLYRDGGALFVQSSHISGNSAYGAYNAGAGTLFATYNYWGASNGPNYPAGLYFGSGDVINSGVDASHYLDQAQYLNFWNGVIQMSVQSKSIKWAWYNSTSTYASDWYSGVGIWNTYGNSVGGVSIATSTTGSTTANLVVLDVASSSSDYFYALYDHNPTPQQIKFNPYWMSRATTSVRVQSATHELGHSLGLWHSFPGNIMLSYATSAGQTSLGTQDILDYNYLNSNVW